MLLIKENTSKLVIGLILPVMKSIWMEVKPCLAMFILLLLLNNNLLADVITRREMPVQIQIGDQGQNVLLGYNVTDYFFVGGELLDEQDNDQGIRDPQVSGVQIQMRLMLPLEGWELTDAGTPGVLPWIIYQMFVGFYIETGIADIQSTVLDRNQNCKAYSSSLAQCNTHDVKVEFDKQNCRFVGWGVNWILDNGISFGVGVRKYLLDYPVVSIIDYNGSMTLQEKVLAKDYYQENELNRFKDGDQIGLEVARAHIGYNF